MPLYSELDDLECPDCGGAMELKQPPYGTSWKPFYSCLSFPKCRGTRRVDGKEHTKRFSQNLKPLTLSKNTETVIADTEQRFIRMNGKMTKYVAPDTYGMTQDQLKVVYLQAKGFIPPDDTGGKSISYNDNRSLLA